MQEKQTYTHNTVTLKNKHLTDKHFTDIYHNNDMKLCTFIPFYIILL